MTKPHISLSRLESLICQRMRNADAAVRFPCVVDLSAAILRLHN